MYYYSLNGQQTGPVAEEQLRQMVASGSLKSDTLVWREGMGDWQPFSTALGGVAAAVQCSVCKKTFPFDQTIRVGDATVCADCKPRFVQGLREGVTSGNPGLYAIALNQRRCLICVLALILCNLSQAVFLQISPIVGGIFAIGSIVAVIFSIISVYRLAKSLNYLAVIYAIAMIIPCINLLTLLVVVSRATQALKKGGVRVGLVGVSKADIERLRTA